MTKKASILILLSLYNFIILPLTPVLAQELKLAADSDQIPLVIPVAQLEGKKALAVENPSLVLKTEEHEKSWAAKNWWVFVFLGGAIIAAAAVGGGGGSSGSGAATGSVTVSGPAP